MRKKNLIAGSALALVLACAPGLAWAQAQTQSLADVARKKPSKRAARVITNDDIPESVVLAGTSSTDEGQQAGDGSAPQASDRDGGPAANTAQTGERAGADEASRLKSAANEELALKDNIAKLKEEMKTETDEFKLEADRQMLEGWEANLADAGKRRRELEQQITDKKAHEKSGEQKNPR